MSTDPGQDTHEGPVRLGDDGSPSERWHGPTWLVAQSPTLTGLVARIPGGFVEDGDGPLVDVDAVAAAVAGWDAAAAAVRADDRAHPEPGRDGPSWDAWRARRDDAAATTSAGEAVAVMSTSERTRLRLVAALSPDGTLFRVGDLATLDEEGQRTLAQWSQLIRSAQP